MKLDQKFNCARGEITEKNTIDPLAFFQDNESTVQQLLDAHAKERVVELLAWSIGECAWSLELEPDGTTTILGHLEELRIPKKWQEGDAFITLRVPLSTIIENEIFFAHEGRMHGPALTRGALGETERLRLEYLARRLHTLAAMVETGLLDIAAATDAENGEPNP
jgi:hypothetical protein